MRSAWKYGVTTLAVGYFGACAPVNFEKAPEPPCGNATVQCVVTPTGTQAYTLERRVGEAMADILFVVDNSGSMSYEHDKMATKFPNFISNLDGLNINYRIGMITTDVTSVRSSPSGPYSPKAANGYGAFSGGNLLEFGGGRKFVSNADSDRSSAFIQTVRRQETLDCQNSGFQFASCPSDDESGIFAANLLLDKESASNAFFRPTAHLAVVILADEDERGISDTRGIDTRQSTSYQQNEQQLIASHPLHTNDKPATFINKLKSLFPAKTLSVHPIIVQPGDFGCKDAQASQYANVRGDFGYAYSDLKQSAGGTTGSICASDYGSSLTNIASTIANQVTSLPFSCRPINDDYDVTFDPQPSQNVSVTADFSKLVLNINTPLPPLTKVTLKYECLRQ